MAYLIDFASRKTMKGIVLSVSKPIQITAFFTKKGG